MWRSGTVGSEWVDLREGVGVRWGGAVLYQRERNLPQIRGLGNIHDEEEEAS